MVRKGANPTPSLDFPSRTIPAESVRSHTIPAVFPQTVLAEVVCLQREDLQVADMFLLGVQEVPGSNPGGPIRAPGVQNGRRPHFNDSSLPTSLELAGTFEARSITFRIG